MADKLVSAAQFARDRAVPAYALGGRVAKIALSGTTPTTLAGKIPDKASVLMFRVPVGQVLYVGNVSQVGDLEGDDARDLMIDFPAGHWPFSLIAEDEADAVFLGQADFTLRILQAATLGEE